MVSSMYFNSLSHSETSVNSFIAGISISKATLKMKKLTNTDATGSKIVHLCPRSIAPPIPTNVPIDEKASER